MNINDMITRAKKRRDEASDRARRAQEELVSLREAPDLDEGMVRSAISRRDAADRDLREAEDEIVSLERERAADDDYLRQARDIRSTGVRRPSYDQVMRVGSEARTYRADQDPNGKQFLNDVARQFLFNEVQANERLSRHMQEERVERGEYLTRATGTGAFSGLVVPQYLTDQYAPQTSALRPLADVMNKQELPTEGMTVNISKITTGSSVALQASENAAVSETDMDDTLLSVPVLTAAGQQTVSRQAIERGTGIENVTMQDLMRKYATAQDSTIITQATTGALATAQATTYTDAAPTAAALWPVLFQAQSKLEQALQGVAMPDYLVMHSRRWNWLCAQVGTSFPFIGTASSDMGHAGGVIVTSEYGPGVRGVLSNGMKVIVDNNMPTNSGTGTNQDDILQIASSEAYLWEDPNAPVMIRAEQAKLANLGVLLVCYGYFAYSFQRYANNPGKVSGTGLVAPAGF